MQTRRPTASNRNRQAQKTSDRRTTQELALPQPQECQTIKEPDQLPVVVVVSEQQPVAPGVSWQHWPDATVVVVVSEQQQVAPGVSLQQSLMVLLRRCARWFPRTGYADPKSPGGSLASPGIPALPGNL